MKAVEVGLVCRYIDGYGESNWDTAMKITLAVAAGVLCACASQEPLVNDAAIPPWSLTYHDGSGNGYRLVHEIGADVVQFVYTPVTPALSSSGTYSGGDPIMRELSASQAAAVISAALRLERNAEDHAPNRAMGTGSFRISTQGRERRFLISSGATLQAFHALAKHLRNAND